MVTRVRPRPRRRDEPKKTTKFENGTDKIHGIYAKESQTHTPNSTSY